MGQRGELFSTRFFAEEGRKTYFFNVKENRYHDIYLNIVESRKTERGFRRSSVVVFQENLDMFAISIEQVISCIQHRQDNCGQSFTVDNGRREYTLKLASQGKPALQITESRQDDSGFHREMVYVSTGVLDIFMARFKSALSYANTAIQNGRGYAEPETSTPYQTDSDD
ncbi:MAG: hypothetical protein B0D92_04725 [Spirochaeta sp. LUC14_002_19_P3]|nr:MAG: hypothetical protein B0D92_04725 [Spirochaeta sp. LUC14_002_19_P3]